jgi:hypothetical protein
MSPIHASHSSPESLCLGHDAQTRETGTPSLLDAHDYLELLAEVKREKLEPAAVRWHGRPEAKAPMMTLAESHLVLAALSEAHARLRRVWPTLVRGIG